MNSSLPMLRARALGLAIALALGPAQVFAQEMDHSQMHMPAPRPAPAAPNKPQDKKPTAAPVETQAADPHAGHVMPKSAAVAAPESDAVDHAAMGHDKPSTGSAMQAEPMDHSTMDHSKMDHSRMDHSTMDHSTMDHSTMDHSKMDHSRMDHGEMDHAAMGHAMGSDLPASASPLEPIPVVTAADRAAAFPDVVPHAIHDNSIHWFALADRLETWDADEGGAFAWEAVGWTGTDLDRLWLRSEGESIDGSTESANVEVFYGRAIARWWDAVAGIRHDFGEGPSQTFAGIGVIGMAPYKFEVEATAYVGDGGQTAANVEVEYDTLLTNRLILQWLVEAEAYGKDDPRRGIGSGLSKAEAGLRLRYELTRRFAPYIGVVHERAFGGTADLRREDGGHVKDTRVVAGVRIWF